jgi:thiol-disulfide isomerase/thioredoxin
MNPPRRPSFAGPSDGRSVSRRQLVVAGLAWGSASGGTALAADRQRNPDKAPVTSEGPFPSLAGATGWLNSAPLSRERLRGKTVLVNFWTYSCINWMRAHPYVRAWSHAYAGKGLVVIGVHTPEFDFERDLGNVRRAAQAYGVDYPVAIDNDHAVWRAFSNEYWPALYLVDGRGRIRHHRFGEGDYAASEDAILHLLAEAGTVTGAPDRAAVTPTPLELAADWEHLRTPETYLGYGRAERFASAASSGQRRSRRYDLPDRLELNGWGLAGAWTIGEQRISLDEPGGRIACRFQARDAHLVMGPTAGGRGRRFRVSIDGRPPGDDHGVDTDAEGRGTVVEPRLYQIVRQQGAIADRRLEIEFLDRGVDLYSFTFG